MDKFESLKNFSNLMHCSNNTCNGLFILALLSLKRGVKYTQSLQIFWEKIEKIKPNLWSKNTF